MEKAKLTEAQKKLDIDLWIIIITTLTMLGVYMIFNQQLMMTSKNDSIHILLRVLLFAAFQFGVAGLGITVVSVLRKESFCSHGLRKKGAFLSIILCGICCMPHLVFMFTAGQVTSYLPFQSVNLTGEVLASGFPVNLFGMAITIIAWGFFEGFNYVVISDKINERYPSKNKWLNWGAFSCAVMCILVHGAIGITPDAIIEMLCIMFLIYGMLIVRERTGNAWGCIAVFVLFWNAF